MARHIEHSRSDVLAAARRILRNSTTVRGLTMSSLAAELGTSKSSSYRYFDSREDLIVAIAQDALHYIEENIAWATTRNDLANMLNLFAELAPGALFETRGGKRDQLPRDARELLTLAVAAITAATDCIVALDVPSALRPAVTVAIAAAVSTPPTMLSTSRRDALAAAMALFAAVSK